jgi:SpoIID/LytB domain protein
MCQFGAIGMASAGASFRQILAHYYPNTTLTSR